MRKGSAFTIIFSVLLACNAVFGSVYDYPAEINNISKKIPKLTGIKCKFRQEKQLQNISKPIVSGGDFCFIEGKGVYFYTKYPIVSTVDYTNKNYKQINDIINAITSKKYCKLEKEFEFYFTEEKDFWILGVKPKKCSNAYNYISSITIEGKDYIRKIVITQTNGNKTKIWFTK